MMQVMCSQPLPLPYNTWIITTIIRVLSHPKSNFMKLPPLASTAATQPTAATTMHSIVWPLTIKHPPPMSIAIMVLWIDLLSRPWNTASNMLKLLYPMHNFPPLCSFWKSLSCRHFVLGVGTTASVPLSYSLLITLFIISSGHCSPGPYHFSVLTCRP
jgi:hypothetical protein